MSELKARNSSELKSFSASELNAFGLGAKLLFLARESDVQMEWSVDFVHVNISTGVKLSTVAGTVILHDRWFWVTFCLMAASINRGKTLVSALISQGYSAGTPEPVDELHNDGNLTLITGGALALQWRGWLEIDNDGEAKASHIDTGSTIEFYGFINLTSGTTQFVKGVYVRAPNVLEPLGTTDDWIMIYFDGAGGLEVSPTRRVTVRVKCVVTG